MLLTLDAFAGERFHIVAPDRQSMRVLNVQVQVSDTDVSVTQLEPLPVGFHATSVALDPSSQRVVVTSSDSGANDRTAAMVSIDSSGELRLISKSTLATATGYTSIDRTGRYFLSVNYATGAVAVSRLMDDRVGAQVHSLTTPQRQAHCIVTTPDNRFVHVPCVKDSNAIYQYRFDSDSGHLDAIEPLDALPPAMFGPRHVVYHSGLPIAYFSNEQQLGVSVYRIGERGQLSAIQHATTMPRRSPFVQGKRDLHASDLALSRDGERLFVAVRDFGGDEDSIFTFRVNADGRLSLLARTHVGDIPWKLALSPSGRHLLVSEAFDHRLSIWAIEADGELVRRSQIDWGAEVRDMVVVNSR